MGVKTSTPFAYADSATFFIFFLRLLKSLRCQQVCDDPVFFSPWPCSSCTLYGGSPCRKRKRHRGARTHARDMAYATRAAARPRTSAHASTALGPTRTSPTTRPLIARCALARMAAGGLISHRQQRRLIAMPSARGSEIVTAPLVCAFALPGTRGKPATCGRARADALAMGVA